MKTLRNKALLYDRECPMCDWYTGYFIKKGALEDGGRIAWDSMNAQVRCQIDPDRARHEIAMVDLEGGQTKYGLEGLTEIVGNMFPASRPVLRLKAVRFFLKGLYQIITYNRRLIAGTPATNNPNSCKPDFNLGWRLVYLFLTYLTVVPVLFSTGAKLLNPEWGGWLMLGLAAMGGLVQGLLTLKLPFEQQMDLQGNLATIALIGSLPMVPLLVLLGLTGWNLPLLTASTFLAGQAIAVLEWRRRLKGLGVLQKSA